jgi:hypothetical protein
MLAPAVMSFINDDYAIVLVECNEEDSKKKEIDTSDNEEAEEEKSPHFFYESLLLENSFVTSGVINEIVFIEKVSTPSLEIKLPPPENFI